MKLKRVLIMSIAAIGLSTSAYSVSNNTANASSVPSIFKKPATWVSGYYKVKPQKFGNKVAYFQRYENLFSSKEGFNPIYLSYTKDKKFITNSNVSGATVGENPVYKKLKGNVYKLTNGASGERSSTKFRINANKSITILGKYAGYTMYKHNTTGFVK
ncbi:hypothetical protein [Nicoliella lavandulae]|uniref:DUF5776 domain-containing protein n=1 Tax=Nicoliella lavandulae TaxID=3082954 RepID=A0ABU8SLZ1_9LACO